MLKLKEEIKARGEDVVIYKHRSRLVFPIDTPEEDYPKWQKKGFNIFRCVECDSMDCSSDCTGEYATPLEDSNDAVSDAALLNKVEAAFSAELEKYVDIFKGDESKQDYDKMTLKELRVAFPDIKAVSKKDFIKQIEEQSNE